MDERIQVYETKMGKTLSNLEGEPGTIRAGRKSACAGQNRGRLLWNPDPDPAGCHVTVPEARDDPDPAVGS